MRAAPHKPHSGDLDSPAAAAPRGPGVNLEHALALAYRYINRRERTVGEMRAHLLARDVGPDAAEAAIRELSEFGYLDDARFAGLFAQDKRQLEGWGAERIRRELLGRGIDRELAEAAASGGSDEFERAVAMLRRRFSAPLSDRRERDRALGVLLRKGYDYELALEAIAALGRE